LVTPSGGKLWRLKYRFGGTEKLLSLGKYPQTSLADIRQKRDQALAMLAQEIDPGVHKKAQKTAGTEETDTFGVIAREWYEKFSLLGRSATVEKSSVALSYMSSPGWAANRSSR
jgi:hypothetical protein